MLKPRRNSKYTRMTAKERVAFEKAVGEELAAKEDNLAAARKILPQLKADLEWASAIVRQLREIREAAGVSLAEIEKRTGIRKSALSRLENSKAPNPTLATLRRYADAIGATVAITIDTTSRNRKRIR